MFFILQYVSIYNIMEDLSLNSRNSKSMKFANQTTSSICLFTPSQCLAQLVEVHIVATQSLHMLDISQGP
jgi:hypothetical protein